MLIYFLPFIFFITDITLFYLVYKPFFNLLLIFFCCEFTNHQRRALLGISLLLLMVESVAFYGQFGLNFLFLAPIMILASIGLPHIYSKKLGAILMLFFCLAGQLGAVEFGALHLQVGAWYTFYALFATLSLSVIYAHYSLKY